MTVAQQKTAEAVVAAVRKAFGKESALVLGEGGSLAEVERTVPTGIEVLDRWVLGVGGMPVGRMVEVFGEEGCGKSTLAASCVAACQREGGVAIVADTEYALDPSRAALLGVDLGSLVLLQPGHMEEALAQMQVAVEAACKVSKGPTLVVWDSIAATPTRREVEEGLGGDAAVGERARILSPACSVLARLAAEQRACFLFVNQVRQKIGVLFGNRTTTPGGHAVKHQASVRLQLIRGKSLKEGKGNHVGMTVTAMTFKNKHAPPFRLARARLYYSRGWDNAWSILDHAKDRKLVPDGSALDAVTLAKALQALGWDKGPRALDAAKLLAQAYEGDAVEQPGEGDD